MGAYGAVVRSVIGLLAASALVAVALALYWPSDYRTAIALHDMPCADLDGDGEVTSLDQDIIESYSGQTVPPAPPQADLHPGPPINDQDVDISDIQFLLARIGQSTDCQDAPIGPKALPDLVVESIADAQQPFDCTTPAGVKVTVRNVGGTRLTGTARGGIRLLPRAGRARSRLPGKAHGFPRRGGRLPERGCG